LLMPQFQSHSNLTLKKKVILGATLLNLEVNFDAFDQKVWGFRARVLFLK